MRVSKCFVLYAAFFFLFFQVRKGISIECETPRWFLFKSEEARAFLAPFQLSVIFYFLFVPKRRNGVIRMNQLQLQSVPPTFSFTRPTYIKSTYKLRASLSIERFTSWIFSEVWLFSNARVVNISKGFDVVVSASSGFGNERYWIKFSLVLETILMKNC